MTPRALRRLLILNLATDADDPVLGFTTGWIRELAARVETVDVIAGRVGRVDVPDNTRVHSLGAERNAGRTQRVLRLYGLLLRLLAAGRYDGCFAHMTPLFATMAAPLLAARRVPILLWYAQASTPYVLRRAEKSVQRVFTPSADSFRVPSSKVVVTGHGIDTEFFRPGAVTPHSGFTIGAVGRITPVKNLELVVDAAARLIRSGVDICLRIVGVTALASDRSYHDQLRKQIRDQGIDDRVTFVGAVSPQQMPEQYARLDLLVHAARAGLDKAILEAMSCAVPVVTTNSASAAAVTSVCSTCHVPADAEAIAAAISTFKQMPIEQRTDIGQRLRQVVAEEHSLQRLADRIVEELATLSHRSRVAHKR